MNILHSHNHENCLLIFIFKNHYRSFNCVYKRQKLKAQGGKDEQKYQVWY
jgi:hypothetical protein